MFASGTKRTWLGTVTMSATDQKRIFRGWVESKRAPTEADAHAFTSGSIAYLQSFMPCIAVSASALVANLPIALVAH